jgi:hypothetical protein
MSHTIIIYTIVYYIYIIPMYILYIEPFVFMFSNINNYYFSNIAKTEPIVTEPCNPSPCGPNAICTERNGAANCECIAEYIGNPFESCRPECVLSTECDRSKACLKNKCRDPCPGTCGQNARCDVVNHIPVCSCPEGYTGDPFSHCRLAEKSK